MQENKLTANAFAQAALILAIASFIQLLGIEKALLAIIFAFFALRSMSEDNRVAKNSAIAAIVIALLYIIFICRLLYTHLPEIKSLLSSLPKVR